MLALKKAFSGFMIQEEPEETAHSRLLHIGIDLGTVNTIVYVSGSGIVFNEPSVVAFDVATGHIIAVGHDAKRMIGKTHAKIKLVPPLTQGAISDKQAARSFLAYIIGHAVAKKIRKHRSTVLICCHAGLSSIERKALGELASSLGMSDVLVEEEVKAGAIGSGIDIFSANGAMVIDIGGGSTDIGVLSLGDLVVSRSLKAAGTSFDNEIIKYLKFYRAFEIGTETAESVKIELATLRQELTDELVITVAGRDLQNGLPSTIQVRQSEIRDVLLHAFSAILGEVYKVLERTPPEISADIIENGIVITGGGALIDGIQEFFSQELELPVRISRNPLTSIALGTKVLLKNRGNYLVKPYD